MYLRFVDFDFGIYFLFSASGKDNLSHYILRLVFRSYDRRHWFVTLETLLFELRLRSASNNSLGVQWCKIQGFKSLTYSEVSEDKDLYNYLMTKHSNEEIRTHRVYRVEFEKALSLVAKRGVFLRGGYVYMLVSALGDHAREFFINQFKTKLRIDLERMDKGFDNDDERVKSLLNTIPDIVIQYEYKSHQINITNLDEISTKHFPLCMKYMHDQLAKKRHLKHDARLQYGLFLKGIGVSMEDSLEYWRSKMEETSFKKNSMAYNIRHNYGKEGGRKDYSPFECKSIIFSSAQSDSDHGCPFKHKSKSQLVKLFEEAGINEVDQKEIISLFEGQQYNEACKAYYKFTHGGKDFEGEQNHPNKYFDLSYGRKRNTRAPAKEETA